LQQFFRCERTQHKKRTHSSGSKQTFAAPYINDRPMLSQCAGTPATNSTSTPSQSTFTFKNASLKCTPGVQPVYTL